MTHILFATTIVVALGFLVAFVAWVTPGWADLDNPERLS